MRTLGMTDAERIRESEETAYNSTAERMNRAGKDTAEYKRLEQRAIDQTRAKQRTLGCDCDPQCTIDPKPFAPILKTTLGHHPPCAMNKLWGPHSQRRSK